MSPEPKRNTLKPGFWVIDYATIFAEHRMTLPTRAPSFSSPGIDNVSYEAWDASSIAAQDMLDDLVAALKPCFQEDTTLNLVTIYDWPDDDEVPTAIATASIAENGTDTTAGWQAAVQVTLTGRDTAGNITRNVLLDVATNNQFGRSFLADINATYIALHAIFAGQGYAFSSRKNFKPDVLIQQAITLNEKLRREYHLN